MSERIACLAPGCRRTRANPDGCDEWLCRKHWSMVPTTYRRAYCRAQRRFNKSRDLRQLSITNRLWLRCVNLVRIEVLQGFPT